MSESMEKTMRMRTYVLKEILKTEKDYVDTLKFLVSVFMERLKNREEDENDKLIPEGSVKLLLSNVEELYAFHQEMLVSIEEALAPAPAYEQKIGQAFLKYKSKFEVYAPYCSNHERAQKKLNELTENQEFQGFILGCLMLGNYVNDVSMEGFLLTPIQRICKYPLLLRELMKKTPSDHEDYEDVKNALNLMKDVCSNVNETKRQLEQLEKLEDLQATIANWEGADLTDTCTRLIKQGSLLKISAGNIQERQFFLFDHLLVYSKKSNTLPRLQATDSTKSGTLPRSKKIKRKKSVMDPKKWIFKGRISTELMEIENLEDGASDFHCGGYTVNNGWKVLNAAKNKWFVLLAKDKEEKEAWLNEFIMERERRRSKTNIDQRDTIDVMHCKGRRIYYKATHQGLIKDRKSKMRVHPKALLGNDFVNWLVENKEANSKEEAVMLGQALLDCGIIHHVQDKHHFKNEAVLFRFRYDDGTFKHRGESQDLVAKGLRIYCRVHCLFQPIVKDKDRQLRSYKQVVEARKLIDWLVEQGDCQNREEASNLGQSLCENGILHHALDKQDFKDESSLFKFFPDEELGETNKLRDLVKKSSTKYDFKFQESYKTKTLLLLNVSGNDSLGFEAKYIEQQAAVVITSIDRGSQAQVQGFQPGQHILQINNDLLTACTSQEQLDNVIKFNLEKYKLIHVTVKADDELMVAIPVTREGMGFQIRGSNPCVVHAVARGGMAMNAGLVKGHAILKVNGKEVTQNTHDDVAAAIRDGCKLPTIVASDKEEEEVERKRTSSISSEEEKMGSNNSLSVPGSGSGLKKSRSFKRKNLAMLIGINHTSLGQKEKKEPEQPNHPQPKSDSFCLQLLVGNRHLERTCTYNFDNVNGVRNHVVERMSECPSIFDLSAQLLEVLIAEDDRVLADVQALEQIAPFITEAKKEVFQRRRSLRYEVIQDRLDSYKRYKRHLASYMWPSYKESRERPPSLTAKDFCPTNCHVNLLQVSNASESYNLRGFGLADKRGEAQTNTDVANMVHTHYAITCLAAPSFRTRGKEGHGLMAVLRGVEGNTELMDSIRQLMVALDHALLELRQGQCQLINILNSETNNEGKRNSYQAVPMRESYQINDDVDEVPKTPLTPPTNFYGNAPTPDAEKESNVDSPSIVPNHSKESSTDSAMETDMIQSSGTLTRQQSGMMSPTIHVQSEETNAEEQGEKSGEQKSKEVVKRNNGSLRKSQQQEEGSVTGNDSECDSGIQSDRGSMVVSENNFFNFSNPPGHENNSAEKSVSETRRPPAMSNSSDMLSTPGEVQHRSLKGANSLPSLTSPPPNGNVTSPVKLRPKTSRPGSRVTFSAHDRVSMISATESNCSSDGVEGINFIDLVLSPDALDKLQGTMEHFLSKIRSLNELVRSETVKTVFENTQDTTPNRKYSKIIEALTASTSDDAIKMALSVCEDTEQFTDVINTLIESVDRHVNEVRTQLVLSVLLNEDPKLVSRRDKVFSQCLQTAISSFSTQLRSAIGETFNNMKAYGVRPEEASKKWLEQCMSIGATIMFQTMLNPNMPDECAMLEDSCVGVNDLERVSFHFRAITGDVEPNECPCNCNNSFNGASPVHIDANGIGYSMEGNRCALKVYFHLDKHVFIKLPPRLQAGGGVKLIPVIFNHGLEDLGNYLYEQGVSLQNFSNSINEKALQKTYDYYKKFRAFHLDRSKLPRDTEARAVLVDRLSRPLNALDEIMSLLEANVKSRHGKPSLAPTGCGVLPLAAEFCGRLGGCHIIACNNGVHRSTLACCLEEALILARSHGLPPKYLVTAAYQLMRTGARLYSEVKNPESRDRTVKSAPRLFKLNQESEQSPT
uniref:Phosphatidylinositol 3,4,5-trisphosphate-dependent Rac exchanger 1 protein n=1 Tax=Phallusia mammillata TaxID=59560 RepID=A0A6F9DQ78_9ASCI|nr:phosphatidylinositol 3,4,5-trisphosphate-dependent Rac exchanger 1 protein [Phallusia mammillata]